MKLDRARLLLVVVLVVLLFGVLTTFFWDFVRDTIAIPIYYLLWVGNLTLRSIPQQAYLGVISILSALIAIQTLRSIRVNRPRPTYIPDQYRPTSRYIIWRKVVTTLQSSSFSREQFITEARKLVISLLAYQYSVSEAEIDDMVRGGVLTLPDAIHHLLDRQGLQVEPPPIPANAILRWRDRLFRPAPPYDPHLDQQVEEIIQYIEQQMELTYARS